MRRRARALVVGVALVAAVLVVLLATAGSGPASQASVAPFSLPALGGGAPVSVPVVHQGTRLPVVLVFFASWCGPCQGELPKVAEVADQLTSVGTKVAFIGVDGNDDPASGLAFAQHSGIRFPIGNDADSVVAPRFGIPGYPATVFIDSAGDVAKVVRGPVSPSTLRSEALRIALSR